MVSCQRSEISPEKSCVSPERCGTWDRPRYTAAVNCAGVGFPQGDEHKAAPAWEGWRATTHPRSRFLHRHRLQHHEERRPPSLDALLQRQRQCPKDKQRKHPWAHRHKLLTTKTIQPFYIVLLNFKLIFLQTAIKLAKAKRFVKLNIHLDF